MSQYSLKRLFFWTLVICLLLAWLRIPLKWLYANFSFYHLFQPLWYTWGWLAGLNVNGVEPNSPSEVIAALIGVIITVVSFVFAVVLTIELIIDLNQRWR
jgi:hypothetical protein